jgi:cell division protein FtsB
MRDEISLGRTPKQRKVRQRARRLLARIFIFLLLVSEKAGWRQFGKLAAHTPQRN